MTIIVTGGAGFIGSNFVLDWLAHGDTACEAIVNLDALTYAGHSDNLAALDGHARHDLVHGDIPARALLDPPLAEPRPRASVHSSAQRHADTSAPRPPKHQPGPAVHTTSRVPHRPGTAQRLPLRARQCEDTVACMRLHDGVPTRPACRRKPTAPPPHSVTT